MSYVSSEFLLGFILTTLLYFLCPARIRWFILLISSVVFYWYAEGWIIVFILFVSLLSYVVARRISARTAMAQEAARRAPEDAKQLRQEAKRKNKRLLVFALIVMIGLLAYVKFGARLMTALRRVLAGEQGASVWQVIFPLGISYFTFSAVGYVLDVYWKRYEAEKNFFRYLLYITYFPHVVQGPIPRYGHLGPQFASVHRFDYDRVCFGAQLMLWGFFQKLVIADRLSVFVSLVYGNIDAYPGSALLFAIFLYAFQIYTDFSGCVDIARGASQVFGIELDLNFRQPYFATSVDDFWRRWHITLGAWFRDYLCMPVTVSSFVKKWSKSVRKKHGRHAAQLVTVLCPLTAVWICTGVWHGTGWNYMLWALWQGGIIALSLVLEPWFPRVCSRLHIRRESFGWRVFQMIRTFILAGIVPRIFVRSGSVPQAMTVFRKIFTQFELGQLRGIIASSGVSKVNWAVSALALLILFAVSVMKERGVSIRQTVARQHILIRWCLYLGLLFFVVIFGIYGPGYDAKSFIYADF